MEPSRFTTGTIGAAHSANWIGSMTPACSSLSNTFSILGRRAYGTVLALQNLGGTLESMCTLAVVPVTSPSSSRKAVSCRDSTDCRLSECTRCSAFQSSWISASQSRPSKLGPEPGTMSRLRLACCVPNVTATFTLPRTSSASPVYVRSLTSLGWRGGAVSAVHSVRYVLSLMNDAVAPVSTSMLSGASLSWTVTSIGDDLRPVVWKSGSSTPRPAFPSAGVSAIWGPPRYGDPVPKTLAM